jgi:cytochrome c peroxidase
MMNHVNLTTCLAVQCFFAISCGGGGDGETATDTNGGSATAGESTDDPGTSDEALRRDHANPACRVSEALQQGALGHGIANEPPYDEGRKVRAGRRAFNDRSLHHLGGNGRACADCHMASDSFQLSPAIAKARFDALEACRKGRPNWDDPLFRPADADDFRANSNARDFTNLTVNGLIRVTFSLPENIKLVDPATGEPSTETEADVWRAVPTVNNVAITGPDGQNPWPREPNRTGGYQLDARKTTLQDQALGALLAHAQVTSPPPQRFLDDVSAFEQSLFSSNRVRNLSDAMSRGTVPLPSGDPPLDPLEQQGKNVFARSCAVCHGGPSQTATPSPVRRFHDIDTTCPRPLDKASPARWSFAPCLPSLSRNVRTYEITLPSGVKVRRASSDPGRALSTGFVDGGPPPADDWNKLDVPTLFGISQTAPYFHNNSAATLEAVLDHYTEFFKFVEAVQPPGVVPPVASTDGVHFDRKFLPEERPALLAYLRKL